MWYLLGQTIAMGIRWWRLEYFPTTVHIKTSNHGFKNQAKPAGLRSAGLTGSTTNQDLIRFSSLQKPEIRKKERKTGNHRFNRKNRGPVRFNQFYRPIQPKFQNVSHLLSDSLSTFNSFSSSPVKLLFFSFFFFKLELIGLGFDWNCWA